MDWKDAHSMIIRLLFNTGHLPARPLAFSLKTVALCHFILPLLLLLEGVSGYDGSSADADASVPQPAAGSDPPEATSPNAPAGIDAVILTLI